MDMAKAEQPIFILPKKRNGKKMNNIASHVDHIITVQGADSDGPAKYKNGLSPVAEHVVNGIIHSTMEGLKSNMKINLPIINDETDEDMAEVNMENESDNPNVEKDGYQALPSANPREMDLSPIYEHSSDASSSHGDLIDENEERKSYRVTNFDNNECSSVTPNSGSQTQSECSFEMGGATDSLKSINKMKKKVNIVSGIMESEIAGLRGDSQYSISPECSFTENSRDGYLTMTGTIKRGKNKGQNVDVKLNMSKEELEKIEAAIVAEEYSKMDVSKCSAYNGPHIFFFTLFCLPFVSIISAFYSFYLGTVVWYNILAHVLESRNCCKKVVLTPILVLLYPLLIILFTVGVGVYAGILQLSFSGSIWWKDVCDFEKGFYGWICNKCGYSECCPYEVVILLSPRP